MGEYICLDGATIKIGVCENLWIRYSDLAEWVATGRAQRVPGNAEPVAYLQGGYRFRFPFPDEDGPEADRLATYDHNTERGILLPWPESLPHTWAHDTVRITLPMSGDGPDWVKGEAGIVLPCPWAENSDWRHYGDRPGTAVVLKQQRPFGGQLWAVVGCPYCGALWRVDPATAQTWAAYLADYAGEGPQYDGLGEIVRRILAGYQEVTP